MADWAIVIGIDEYWRPEACLKGAVRDALRMREWLLDPNAGGVPSRNLSLLLAPSDPRTTELPQYVKATQDNIISEIDRLLNRSGEKGDRLYFHYSGHGLTNRVNYADEEVLIPTDFTDKYTQKSLGLGSVLKRFQATQFIDQFFFIDACRNIPWEDEFITGYWPRPKKGDPALPAVQQYVFLATSPGVKARELREAGNERGAFTEALLEGLRGRGKAKGWDPGAGEYVVLPERLFKYVEDRLKDQRIRVGDETARELIQIPRLTGERGGHDQPILARLLEEEVKEEGLGVYLEPSEVVPVAEITVERDRRPVCTKRELTGVPVSFDLPPREYAVSATAVNYKAVEKRVVADLWSPLDVKVRFIAAPGAPTAHINGGPSEDAAGGTLHDAPVEEFVGQGAERDLKVGESPSEPAKLVVESDDGLAPLEVIDSIGNIVETGQGRIEASLEPGYYHAAIRTPENQVTEKLVEVASEETETVHLRAPEPPQTRLIQEIIEETNLETRDDSTLEVSVPSEVGPVAAPRLSTILTLAGTVANHDERKLPARRLRNLNPKGFRSIVGADATSGIYLVFGFNSNRVEVAREHSSGARLRVWPQAEPVPEAFDRPSPFSDATGLAEYARPTEVGPHWVSIELPGQKPILFVLTMVPQRFSMLVLERHADGTAQAFQYLPRIEPDIKVEPEALRQSELIQRFYLSNRFGRAYDLLDSPVPIEGIDPLAEFMTGYLMLRLGKTARLGAVADRLTSSYPGLSDGYVLKAEYEASRKNYAAAVATFRTALDHGLPLFTYGLMRLFETVEENGIQHPRRTLLSRVWQDRAPKLLWSAWIPKEEIPFGTHLDS